MTRNLLLVLAALILPLGCSDNPEAVRFGDISVSVVDPLVGPVADVEVTVAPDGLVGATDASGLSVFHVPVGDHVVQASVCCAGPGLINQESRVTVKRAETVEVQFGACLLCD